MPTLLTFGDSNTHGTCPIRFDGDRRRLPPTERWPGRATAILGSDWTLIEEGLPGRTTQHPDSEMGPHMDGRVGLFIALQSHGPIDVMTLMLGTNDLKLQFDITPEDIVAGADILLNIALSEELQDRHGGFDILLICPPPVLECGVLEEGFKGAQAKSNMLSSLYRDLAQRHDVDFLDAGQVIKSSEVDGIHFDADQHKLLGTAVSQSLQQMQINL